MRHRPLLTYGAMSKIGKVEVRYFDADHPELGARDLIIDGHTKIDPYGLHLRDFEFIFTGIKATATSHIYRRPVSQGDENPFTLWKKLPLSRASFADQAWPNPMSPLSIRIGYIRYIR